MALDGAWYELGAGLAWEALGHLKTSEVGEVMLGAVRRMEKHLRRRGLLRLDDGGADPSAGAAWCCVTLCGEDTQIAAAVNPTDRREVAAYRPGQVAAWLNLPTATVRAWAKGQHYDLRGKRGFFRPVIEPTRLGIPRNAPLTFSFVNFVELHVLSALRRVHAIPLPKIRRSIEYLARHYPRVQHPLADLDLLTDGLDVWLAALGRLVAVSGHGQLGIKDVLEAHLRRVDRGPRGEALRLYPFPRPGDVARQPRSIVVDPDIAFGRPTLAGTGIPTQVIAGRFDAGESLESLVDDFARPADDILEAIRWELREQRAA